MQDSQFIHPFASYYVAYIQKRILIVIAIVWTIGILCPVSTALAQKKAPMTIGGGNSAGPTPKRDPKVIGDTQKSKLDRKYTDQFRAAYEEDNFPSWLTVVGLDSRAFGGKEDNRNVAGQQMPILLFDPTGISDMLQSRINYWLRKNRDVELLSLSELTDRDKRRANAAASEDAQSAVEMLANSTRAEVVFYLEIRAVPKQLHGDEPMFVGLIQMRDRRTGRSIHEDTFRWSGQADVRTMNSLAVRTLERSLPEYSDWVENRPQHIRIELEVLDLADAQQLRTRRIIGDLKDVAGKVRMDVQRRDNKTLTIYSMRYRGDMVEMLYGLNELLSEELGIELRTNDMRDNSALVTAITADKMPAWVLYTDAKAKGYNQARTDLQRGYTQNGRPKIGVVMDRRADESLRFELQTLTGELNNRLRDAGMDIETAQSVTRDQLKNLGFDLVVFGTAIPGIGNAPSQYNISLFDVRNDRFIGAQRWPDTKATKSRRHPVDPKNPEQVGQFLAGSLMGRLAKQFTEAANVDVVVHMVDDSRKLTSLARTLESSIPTVVDVANPSVSKGCGEFTVRYTGRFTTLLEQMEAVQDRFPVKLLGGTMSSGVIEMLMLKPGEDPEKATLPSDHDCGKQKVPALPHGNIPPVIEEPKIPTPNGAPSGKPQSQTPPVKRSPARQPRSQNPQSSTRSIPVKESANEKVTSSWKKLTSETSETNAFSSRSLLSVPPASEHGIEFDGIFIRYKPKTKMQDVNTKGLTFDALKESVLGEIKVVRGRKGGKLALQSLQFKNDLQKYQNDPTVALAMPNYTYHSSAVPETKLHSVQWALQNNFHKENSTRWSDISKQIASIQPSLIGLVDEGMHVNDPRLRSMLWINRKEIAGNNRDDDRNGLVDDLYGYNFSNNSTQLDWGTGDDFNHGSFCGSIMAGRVTNSDNDVIGLSPNAKVLVATVMDQTGSGSHDSIMRGIQYAAYNGAKVINLSLGGSMSEQSLSAINQDPLWDQLEEMNIVLVVAAGNDNSNIDREKVFPACLNRENIITVMAVDPSARAARHQTRTGWKQFSNYGLREVDIAAPGALIIGIPREGKTDIGNGTSYSAPMVTATVSIIQGVHPDWDYKTVIRSITETTKLVDSLQGLCRTGGTLDIPAALAWRP